jgi:hypothetical protein
MMKDRPARHGRKNKGPRSVRVFHTLEDVKNVFLPTLERQEGESRKRPSSGTGFADEFLERLRKGLAG